MEAICLHQVVEKDGELVVTDLPCKKGEAVEVIILTESGAETPRFSRTAKQLLNGCNVCGDPRRSLVNLNSASMRRVLRSKSSR